MLRTRWPRLLSLLVGIWLVVSTLAFRTESSAGFNRLMIGIFVVCSAILAMWAPWFRFVNVGLGVWLFFMAMAFRHGAQLLGLSTIVAGVVLVVLGLVPTPPRHTSPRRAFVNYRP